MDAQIQEAVALHRQGRLADAERIYRRALDANPRHADALHLLGLIACQRNELEPAADLITQALSIHPDNPEYILNLGEVQRRMQRFPAAADSFTRAIALAPHNVYAHYNLALTQAALSRNDQAIESYRRALALDPHFAQALNNLGILLHGKGAPDQAADCFQQALAINPAYVEAHNNLGLALWDLHRPDAALAAFDAAIAADPAFTPAHINAANSLRKLGRRQESIDAFRRAVQLDPRSADLQRDFAMALLEVSRIDEAIAAARASVDLAPQSADAHHVLGVTLAAAARTDPSKRTDALAAYEAALRLQPEKTEWQFERDALAGKPLDSAPDSYVKTLFDAYADRFESHLVNELRYRVPHDLLEHILHLQNSGAQSSSILPPPWNILDLGCGTGLCGELFRPHARRITGIDLSPNMIEISRRRRLNSAPVYDELLCAHILPALQRYPDSFDLILAADVFIYVGALHEILPAAARALHPGGLLAFSLENHDAGDGFILHRQTRFAHSLPYIRALASESGLREIIAHQALLRTDVPPGWLIFLQKPV